MFLGRDQVAVSTNTTPCALWARYRYQQPSEVAGFWSSFSGNGRIQAQPSGSYLMNNYVMNSAITRIGLADNLLPWRKYFTYFYPRFLPLSQLIIPYRTFSRTLLRRKLGECCLNVLVHLNENRGFNFSIFWKEKKKSFFSFVKLVVFNPDCDELPVTALSSGY